ncbi:MAG: hypothetical protein HZB50_02160 [Chloroflexi bacterium]|nr:hypothetical protein [Chloroflexota bacterium]
MRKLFIIFLCPFLLLGCIEQRHNNVPVVTPTSVITETLIVPTSFYTVTPLPATLRPSVTPSLTPTKINTPTSDFQNITQVIFTPASPAICPPDATSEIEIPTEQPLGGPTMTIELPLDGTTIMTVLNNGGVKQIVRFLSKKDELNFRYEDLTNDGVPELIVRNWYKDSVSVYGCQNGEYKNLLIVVGRGVEATPEIIAIQDLNHNGVKELVIEMTASHCCTQIMDYEWNGERFKSLVKTWNVDNFGGKREYLLYSDIAELGGIARARVADVDGNGVYELILDGGRPSYTSGWLGVDGPWRMEKLIYMWNGENYVWYSQENYPPNFRFEAIQDGDTETLRGNYDSALKFYRAAIFDDKLKSWTQEAWRDLLMQNEEAQLLSYPDINKMPFNQKEYDQLAAYARYRIMLLYLKQGWESDAKTVYETLVEKYPQGNSGYPYTELAAAFWNEFQSSHDVSSSCGKAMNYAVNHAEILEPLGSHGLFDKHYEPEDICYFE